MAVYSLGLVRDVCSKLCDGHTLSAVLRDMGIPGSTYYDWLQAYPEAKALHDAHLDPRADALVDEGMRLLDEASIDIPQAASASVTKAWRRAEYRRWLASKLAPARYGDKSAVDLKHSGEVTTYHVVTGIDRAPGDE